MDNQTKIKHSVEIEIPFFDVDAMNITWHGHYIKYFEVARCALLDKIQFNYNDMKASGFSWPIVDLRVKYVRPTKFLQKVLVTAEIVDYENRLKIKYVIHDKESGEKLTEAYTVQVAVCNEKQELKIVSPKALTNKIEDCLS